MNADLKTLLDEKADAMRLARGIPPGVLRRARRRRAATAALAGAVTLGLALGAVVGARTLLEETGTGPRETRPAGTGSTFYPFIYPATPEELENTQVEVAQGSIPMWTDPEGAAVLYAVNVLGWDMESVEVAASGDDEVTAVITNPTLSRAAGSERDIRTTLTLLVVPGSDPPIHAVLAAQAEGLDLEPVGPDDRIGAGGSLAFRGSLGFVPEGAMIELEVDGAPPVSVPAGDGTFVVEARDLGDIGPSTLVAVRVLDRSGATLAITSSRLATPAAGQGEAHGSAPVRVGPPLEIPDAVTGTRLAILDAARARDWSALRELIPDRGFTFSFGGERDPIAYWRKLESEGHVPVLGDILPIVLSTEAGRVHGGYIWPGQAAEDPTEWDEGDLSVLRQIHADEDIRTFQEFGAYLGWRVEIARDGTWISFVAGD